MVTKLSERIGVLEDDLKKTNQTYSSAFTKLILRIKKLEYQVKIGKARKRPRVVLSKDVEDDSSKQRRKLSDAEVQEKASTETEPIIQEVTPTKVIQDQGSSEKGNSEVNTAGATKGTASEVPVVSTTESLSLRKSLRKSLNKKRLSFAEAIRLQEQMDEEQRAQIARDEEIAGQWDEQEGQRAMSEAKSSKKIDWNDPYVIRYHALKMKPKTVAQARRNMVKYLKNQGNYKISDFKGMSYNEIRPIFEKVWDFNQHIEPMDLEHGSERMKSTEKIEEEDVDTQKEMKEVSKESGAKRKNYLPRKSTRSKRQKVELDDEKEDLKGYLDIVPREDVAEDVESLSTKYPIMDWKTCVLTENFMYYQIFRGDGSSKNYKVLSEMLEDFDRQDVMDLHRLVKERYSASRPEGYDLMLWGDLHTLFEPDEKSEIWMNQNEYNLLSWSLYDLCGVHILLMQNGIAIHMFTEKKYPLSQEMLSKMLSKRLEVDHESTQAYELLNTNGVSTASTNLVLSELVNTARRKVNTADGQSWHTFRVQIVSDRRWREVMVVFKFRPTITNASFVLRKGYLSLLYHFEEVYFSRKKSPTLSTDSSCRLSHGSVSGSVKNLLSVRQKVEVGGQVTGTIDNRFEQRYLITVDLGNEKLSGFIYHMPSDASVPSYRTEKY
ncbi:putative reverse transcriptase domain-containing protein [Tanacetum coccineum]